MVCPWRRRVILDECEGGVLGGLSRRHQTNIIFYRKIQKKSLLFDPLLRRQACSECVQTRQLLHCLVLIPQVPPVTPLALPPPSTQAQLTNDNTRGQRQELLTTTPPRSPAPGGYGGFRTLDRGGGSTPPGGGWTPPGTPPRGQERPSAAERMLPPPAMAADYQVGVCMSASLCGWWLASRE